MKMLSVAVCGLAAAAAFIYFVMAPAFRGDLILSQGINLGSFSLRYYGLIMGAAVLISYLLSRSNAWRLGISQNEIDRFAFGLILFSFIGARLYFVSFEWDYFSVNAAEIFQVWQGGLAIFGAILGGLAFTLAFSRGKIYSAWQLLDLVALSLPLGQAIGRLGNFINYEAFGSPTSLPWKMFVPEEYRPEIFEASEYFHPAFLYESLGNLLLFSILYKLRGKLKPGSTALMYLSGYSIIRFIIEPLRIDSEYLAGYRVNQWLPLAIILIAACIFISRQSKQKQI